MRKSLKGKMLKEIKVEGDANQLILCCEDENVKFIAEADCCSDSWIEHFESPTEPEQIVSFEEIEIEDWEPNPTKIRDEDNMDDVKYYFYKLTTTKGTYLIEMRNNSNGYYGGWLKSLDHEYESPDA